MGIFEREAYVNAPLKDVWEFHSKVDGLTKLTPSWMNLRIRNVRYANGEESRILTEGSTVSISIKPLGVLPNVSWTSRIVHREEGPKMAVFEDEMVRGPLRKWLHTHEFYEEEGGTRIRDVVEYALPLVGPLGEPFFNFQLKRMFKYRHKRTKEIFEGKGTKRYP
ncbi:MAG: SRPBCC family protein [Halobacteria archaeon]|nr:SRPBCC family protein [Halobacteria archaeon]